MSDLNMQKVERMENKRNAWRARILFSPLVEMARASVGGLARKINFFLLLLAERNMLFGNYSGRNIMAPTGRLR
jgi:hypothetical protein